MTALIFVVGISSNHGSYGRLSKVRYRLFLT